MSSWARNIEQLITWLPLGTQVKADNFMALCTQKKLKYKKKSKDYFFSPSEVE